MNGLFNNISALLPTLHGWATQQKACSLASAVIALRPKLCIEIGVWGGRSLLPMAMALKEIGDGVIWGIDPWRNADSIQGQPPEHTAWWGKVDHEFVYKDFLRHVHQQGVDKFVKVIRKRSDDVEPPESFDLLHCDGNHGVQAQRDVERFAPKIRVGGIAVLDDLTWSGGAVTGAAARLHEMGFVALYRVMNKPVGQDDWAVFEKVKQCD